MDDARKLIDHAKELLQRRPRVTFAYVFGSCARSDGDHEPRDLDVAVMLASDAPDPLRAVLDLGGALERAVGMPVDLLDLSRLPLDLQFRVLREGVVVLDRDPVTRVRWEARVMVEYYDFKPYLDRIRAETLERLASE